MKRLLIPILTLFVGACTNTIDYDFSQVKPVLMVTGWLDQAAASQTVCVSLSDGGLVKPVEEATVTCYVNGKEVATVSAAPETKKDYNSLLAVYQDPAYYKQLPVTFPASLKPGDKVKLTIEANHGTYRASSQELTVPEPVEITRVDTTRVTVMHPDWSDTYLQVRADVPDRKGEDNWYCITLREISDGTYSFQDGGPDVSITLDVTRSIQDIDDPVLLDGGMGQEDLNVFSLSGNGAFACFTDQLFRDGTAHLKMNTFSSWDNEGPDFMLLSDLLVQQIGYEGIESRGLDRCRAEHRLEVRLSHCSQDAYHYLRSLRTISSEGYYPEIVEPVTIPTNIVDGVGFVEVVNTAVARIDLPAEERIGIKDIFGWEESLNE